MAPSISTRIQATYTLDDLKLLVLTDLRKRGVDVNVADIRESGVNSGPAIGGFKGLSVDIDKPLPPVHNSRGPG